MLVWDIEMCEVNECSSLLFTEHSWLVAGYLPRAARMKARVVPRGGTQGKKADLLEIWYMAIGPK